MNESIERAPAGRTFEFVQCLGRGAFGEVYLVNMRNDVVESKVAVKVLRRDVDPTSQAMARLRDEARLLGSLNHPHILGVFDLIALDGRAALVTEYIPGADLGDLATELPHRTVLEIGAHIAAALDAAWNTAGKHGEPLHLVHRDIKPSNIRVGRHGEVKLLDFGIAHFDGPDRESRTQTQKLVGSFEYMAPERLAQRNVGTEADVYSLGCTLYEALHGEGIFQGITVRRHLVYAHSEARHDERITEAVDALHTTPEVRAVLTRLLAYDPVQRPQLAELEGILRGCAEALTSPDLRTWARGFTWPSLPATDGPLVGAVLSEATLDTWTEPPRPAEPTRRRWPALLGAATLLAALTFALWPAPEAPAPPPSPEPAATAPPPPVPSSSPPPAAAPEPEPAPPAPQVRGPEPIAPAPKPPVTRYWFSGAATQVELVSDQGRFPPGEIPPGRYAIEAVFPNTQMGMTRVGDVQIEPGENVEIKCRSGFFACSR